MSKDERLAYEAPRILRLGETRTGKGDCATGSGDSGYCYDTGNTADSDCEAGNGARDECATGNAAADYCDPAGNSAAYDCYVGSGDLP
jgi:hypothetical protein